MDSQFGAEVVFTDRTKAARRKLNATKGVVGFIDLQGGKKESFNSLHPPTPIPVHSVLVWCSQRVEPKSKNLAQLFTPMLSSACRLRATIHTIRNSDNEIMLNEQGELIRATLSPAGCEERSRAKLIALRSCNSIVAAGSRGHIRRSPMGMCSRAATRNSFARL